MFCPNEDFSDNFKSLVKVIKKYPRKNVANVISLSTFKKEGLKIHGESSTKALERIVKKAGKYLKNIH